ncbi:MAG: ThuA domain-containing protein [Pirellulales bacterium]|jgi:type 1 glutamine amidotransferase
MSIIRPFAVAFAALACLFLSLGSASAEIKPDVIAKIEAAIPAGAPAKVKSPRKVLIFSKTNGFRHGSIETGAKSLAMLGEKTGAYTAVHSEDEAMFEPETLKQFDMVIMLNTTGECLRPKQWSKDPEEKKKEEARHEMLKQSLVDFVKSGKGLAGTHSATDTYKNWKDYNDMMGGAFAGHPWHMPVPIRLVDKDHPLNKVFAGEGFTVTDEIYQFRDDTAQPADRKMLLSLDPSFDQIGKGRHENNFYAVSWIAKYGKGRTFYCSLGHRNEIYHNPAVLRHYLAGFQYAMGDLKADDKPAAVE